MLISIFSWFFHTIFKDLTEQILYPKCSRMHNFASFWNFFIRGGGNPLRPPPTAFRLSRVGMYDTEILLKVAFNTINQSILRLDIEINESNYWYVIFLSLLRNGNTAWDIEIVGVHLSCLSVFYIFFIIRVLETSHWLSFTQVWVWALFKHFCRSDVPWKVYGLGSFVSLCYFFMYFIERLRESVPELGVKEFKIIFFKCKIRLFLFFLDKLGKNVAINTCST